MRRCLGLAAALLVASTAATAQTWQSAIVSDGPDGRLVYATDAEGNRVPDFSRAGYGGGGVALPDVPTVLTVEPGDGDDTARIQQALNTAFVFPVDANGFHGAVQLTAGVYEIAGTLQLRQSGVVLRGVGDGDDPATSTILRRSGANQAPIVVLGRSEAANGDVLVRRDASRPSASILDSVVPIGAASFTVDQPALYSVGDPVVIEHPATAAWIAAVDGGGTASDPPWVAGELPIAYARTITAIDGATVTLDAPVFARLDRSLSPSTLSLRVRNTVTERVALEGLRIDIQTVGPEDETQAENAVLVASVENGWVRGVTALHFWHAGVSVRNSRYVTVEACEALEPHSVVTGERRYNFEVYKSQLVLFQGNRATFARHAYVGNGETLDSGIVFLDNTSESAFTSSESHRRWGTGFLYDGHTEIGSSGSSPSDRRIHLGNRGDFGTAHGWACANCVVWNARMNGALVVVEKPPTAQNYAIGVSGQVSNRGPFLTTTAPYIEGTNQSGLDPASLYRRQLADRFATASAPAAAPSGVRLAPAAPNPASGHSVLAFELPLPAHARMTLHDVLGRELRVVADGPFGAGRQTVTADLGGLPAGVYLVRLAVSTDRGTTTLTRRLTRSGSR